MPQPFIGEIRMFAGNFAPAGWAFCDGTQVLISDNPALFSLIGTIYGGDGQTTFKLPDLRARVPVHAGTDPSAGTTFVLGQSGGVETVTLTVAQIPAHSHAPQALSTAGDQSSPSNNVWAASALNQFSGNNSPAQTMSTAAIGATGGSQPHDNMIPFLAVSFIISLFGVFPSQT